MSSFIRLAEHKSFAEDYSFAKKLRRDPTSGEDILWAELRLATRNKDFRFRRQHPIHPYIVDFICLKLCLVVEVDGISHDARIDKDKQRNDNLKKIGYEVMRFTNNDVVANREGVVRTILARAEELLGELNIPRP